jgi:hypothetical protein
LASGATCQKNSNAFVYQSNKCQLPEEHRRSWTGIQKEDDMYNSSGSIDWRLIQAKMQDLERELEQQRLIREAEAASRSAPRSSLWAGLAAALKAMAKARSSSSRRMYRISAHKLAR